MDGFRILEITQPSELHVTANQLTIEQRKQLTLVLHNKDMPNNYKKEIKKELKI